MSSKSETTNILCTINSNGFPVLADEMPVEHWKTEKRSLFALIWPIIRLSMFWKSFIIHGTCNYLVQIGALTKTHSSIYFPFII